jgi:hypothetical protein
MIERVATQDRVSELRARQVRQSSFNQHQSEQVMKHLLTITTLTSLLLLTACGGDKSSERRLALKMVGMSFSEYATKHGVLPVPAGQTIESQVPADRKTCPGCGKAWSYAKVTAEPKGAKDWDPIIAWCATCAAEGGKRDVLTYFGKVVSVDPGQLPK